ncbi:hypothetical protein EZV62_003375 [Acer yangbiense]|uniref:Jacalin-type lectin domain-containing protein n=1 Tax=Acer yangbiense TaxID=1000413 RepID=A0A5C7IGI5_9ROSI|nr:hypothetical protein EZV62_003375 [Acer yangbiense]
MFTTAFPVKGINEAALAHAHLSSVIKSGDPKGANNCNLEITISHGWVIDSLSFKTVDKNGKSEYSDKFGGEGGDSDLIKFDWPKEYLTSISGTHHTFEKQHVIESLCFHTNRTKYGTFGRTKGSPFDLPLKDRVSVIGFHGRACNYINAIGVYQKGPSS